MERIHDRQNEDNEYSYSTEGGEVLHELLAILRGKFGSVIHILPDVNPAPKTSLKIVMNREVNLNTVCSCKTELFKG